ncbi:hypothetical protein IFM89_016737 [Coptis chinensis]|uniref:PI31 proteasome regulator N-terminal domain-containing protein n=1 Tax=Coptis chinensis TaxID=261450 RepID=A0A835IQV6_9MAGN|nr:hypothetical protein IFM89_016737 [Coptis chinensis]
MATEDAVMAVIKASRPTFRNPHDKIAFALHSAFLASGYSLVATGPSAFSDSILSSPPSDEVGIEGWNETEDSYGFVYTKNTVLVKCLVMGDNLVIDALTGKGQDKEPIYLQINVKDYDGGNESTSYSDRYKKFGNLVKTLNSGILDKIDDSPVVEKTNSAPAPSRSEGSERDERIESPGPYPHGYVSPPIIPGHHDDLYPGPGAGMYPREGPQVGGPMLVGPNDRRWFGPLGEQPRYPDGSLAGGVPPGARFDPYGPPGVPGFGPNSFGRHPLRPGPGIHPDLEQPGPGLDTHGVPGFGPNPSARESTETWDWGLS